MVVRPTAADCDVGRNGLLSCCASMRSALLVMRRRFRPGRSSAAARFYIYEHSLNDRRRGAALKQRAHASG
jgi:hypothetical protein